MTAAGEVTIPAFVVRGLQRFDRPGDIASVKYGTEAHLRDALASYWWLHGLTVRTEVEIPRCGRADIVAQTPTTLTAVELKREIKTHSQARKALQQAATYKAYLDHEHRQAKSDGTILRVRSLVTCADANWPLLFQANEVFYDVEANDYQTTSDYPFGFAFHPEREYLLRIARVRREAIEDLHSALRSADQRLCTALEADRGVIAA